jgi:dihydrofolate reductase
MRPLTLIAAMTPAGVIGKDGKIPWHLPEDLRRFKRLTTGHAIVMGRKTHESIGKPLPNRANIVISRTLAFAEKPASGADDGGVRIMAPATGIVICRSFEDALETAYRIDESPFVVGGAEIYALALPLATKLEITYVVNDSEKALAFGGEGLVFFPGLHPNPWVWRCVHAEPAAESPNVEFMTFERRTQP